MGKAAEYMNEQGIGSARNKKTEENIETLLQLVWLSFSREKSFPIFKHLQDNRKSTG